MFASASMPAVKEEYIQLANQLADAAAEITTKARVSALLGRNPCSEPPARASRRCVLPRMYRLRLRLAAELV